MAPARITANSSCRTQVLYPTLPELDQPCARRVFSYARPVLLERAGRLCVKRRAGRPSPPRRSSLRVAQRRQKSLGPGGGRRVLKRTVGIVVASAGMLAAAPVRAGVAALVKREDGGPALYGSVRVGKDGRKFRMWKFRTMVMNADKIGGPNTADDDPRLTRIGKKLRQFK